MAHYMGLQPINSKKQSLSWEATSILSQ
jgi:hypothetical protein